MDLNKVSHIYFIGIGGIGMSSLALYFQNSGKQVSGYDKTPSPITNKLIENGIEVIFDASLSVIPEAYKNQEKTLVIYTPAIPVDHAQLQWFQTTGFSVLKRAAMLGEVTKNSFCLAVAGTHGKTTTSAMLGHIMTSAETGATSFLGGVSENYNSNLILGADKISVVEADEFDRSFLQLRPNIACITSIDADHLDIYGKADALEASFKDFSELVSDTLIVRKGLPFEGKTYGIDEKSDYDAQNLKIENGTYVFDVKTSEEIIKDVRLALPGRHNVLNALAALGMAHSYGVSLEKSKEALSTFKGIQRRFSYVLNNESKVLIDDYAHHPTAIHAVVDAVREMYPNEKVLGVFQPHLYSRTQDFADDFASALGRLDELILLDIYPARELPISGVTSEWLLSKVALKNKQLASKKEVAVQVAKSDATIVVVIGAGDIGELVQPIKEKLIDEN